MIYHFNYTGGKVRVVPATNDHGEHHFYCRVMPDDGKHSRVYLEEAECPFIAAESALDKFGVKSGITGKGDQQ